MENHKNEEYLKKEIMEQSRHLFIYGYNNKQRSEFLKELENDYPVIADADKPVALYFENLGIPKIDVELKDKDFYLIHATSREHLSFAIATKILERSMELDKELLDSRLSRLISLINRSKNTEYNEIKTITDLLRELKNSRDFYYENHINYIKGLIDNIPIDDIAIPFLQLEYFVNEFKRGLNINSYIGLIYDKKNPVAISSIQEVNNLIGARINEDISVKVAIEPDDWETYRDINGQFIEAVHDYGTVELDNSYKANIKKLNKIYYGHKKKSN